MQADQAAAAAAAVPDWVYDPNEPRYCLCNQVMLVYILPLPQGNGTSMALDEVFFILLS